MDDPIRIMIADDHTLFREGIVALLNSMNGIEVVATVADGNQAVEYAAKLQPDVILMDLQMPGMNGIEATRQIIQTSPHIGIIVVTMFEDNDSVFSAMRAGARGYILKGAGQKEMLRAIQAVAHGEAILGPSIAARLMDFFKPAAQNNLPAFPELTERENEILALMAKGANNAEIALQLSISIKTVRNHVSNIFTKLQVTDRVQAILKARDAGLG